MTQSQQKTVLITGASGKFGRHSAAAFAAAGWQIRSYDRARQNLTEAARGADAIIMGMHPPSYELWAEQLLPLHARVIAAAKAHDIPVILTGNLYGFGPDAGSRWGADTEMTAQNPLGLLRRQLEQMYRGGDVRTIMLYCGDFIDDRPTGNWFDRFVAAKVWKGRLVYPGALDAKHSWCWLPDAARIAARLADRADTLERFQPVPMPGYALSAHDMAAAMTRVTGRKVTAKPLAWWPLKALRPFMPAMKGVLEMRYLWSHPHELEGTTLATLLPDYAPTPLDRALAQAIAALPGAPKPQVQAQPLAA
ncbi:epimerase [Pseudooceanicola sp.]|uniref:epimerase n=1 Tax=Pseudooceanicola sp. TaxID=1914328 RepID=UPI002630739A|nr:epimerase [Pseudooceanicola sp.]MDF1857208.1 epimerase [Pseudooceanicola sp.]